MATSGMSQVAAPPPMSGYAEPEGKALETFDVKIGC